jgi:Holliday junction DNA helicase RuvA
MIERVRGPLLEATAGRAVIEVGGLALSLTTPLTTFLRLPSPPTEVALLTRLVIREESWDLFGFMTRPERECFDVLTSVTRVGPRLALTIISALEPQELARTLVDQDLARLSAITGIGQKTAERRVVELKDKALQLVSITGETTSDRQVGQVRSSIRDEAVAALTNLGYTRNESENAVRDALKSLGPETELGDVLRAALKKISS